MGKNDAGDVQYATELFADGRYSEADEIVRKLRRHGQLDNQVIFLSGLLYYQQGEYRSAAGEFRIILSHDPTLLRPRLELARTLYMLHDYDAAQYHFKQVLSSELPVTVRWNITSFLRDIQEKKATVSLVLDVISDSNPGQSTSSEIMEIGGLSYRLKDSAREKASWGLALTVDAKFPYSDNPLWFSRAHLESTAYSEAAMDWSYLQLMLGRHFPFTSHTVTIEVGGHVSYYDHDTLYNGVTLGVADLVRVSPNLEIKIGTEIKEQQYDEFHYLDGSVYGFVLETLYAPNTTSRWEMGLSLSHGDSSDKAYAYQSPGVSVRYVNEWAGGWITGLRLQYARVEYEGKDPLFNAVRDDAESGVEFELIARGWAWNRYAPRFFYGQKKHDSNLPLYSFDREYFHIGITKIF
jgi:tetratricopeptide (TPR) repeat protein